MKLFLMSFVGLTCSYYSIAQIKKTEKWSVHFMNTIVQQGHDAFNAPYSSAISLSNKGETQITVRNTWMLGRKLGKRTTLYFDPELAGGSGLSGVHGIADFPNGEAFRVGSGAPKIYVARLYLRHHISLGPESETIENSFNQVKEIIPKNRITLTLGKYSLLDYFDVSGFANDGRTQFMNWALMTGGAYDFASDTRGNTWGGVMEIVLPKRTIKLAYALPSNTPNGPNFDLNFLKANGLNFDYRQGFQLFRSAATIGFTAFRNRTMGVYFERISTPSNPVQVLKGRQNYGTKFGFVTNLEQQVGNQFAWFLSASWADGKTENWGFTQIDKSLNAGIVLLGSTWKRENDRLGIAGVISGLSNEQQKFLKSGGSGFIIGDGNLRYKPEQVLEAYYMFSLSPNIFLSLDYQYIYNIAYNADRGNIGVWAFRSHVEF